MAQIEERFFTWISDNPHVVEHCLRFARELRESGRKHYGMKAIFERVRWHLNVDVQGDIFKMNNNYTAPMARYLVTIDPTLSGLFQYRVRRNKNKP